MIKKGSIVNETFYLWNNETEQFENERIDSSEIKVEVSDPNIVSIENNIITAKEEGELTVKYKYTYNNMDFEFERTYFIYTDGFETTYEFPIINKSYLNLKVGDTSEKLYAGISQLGSYAVEYPEGYDYNTYYKYEWKAEDNSIVKINKLSDNEITATALKSGTTNIICSISTADGKETINKTIKVKVNDNSTPKKEDDTNISGKDNTIANKILPATGKGIIIFVVIFLLIIMAIVYNKKRKIN